MIAQAARATGERAAGRHVLAIQDTTVLDFSSHAARKRGFGAAGHGAGAGLYLHPLVVVDAEHGGVIGLCDAQILNRAGGKVEARGKRLVEDKESQRWLTGMHRAGALLEACASVTVVADRESDIYAEFATRPDSVHLITRAAQDRALGDGGRLFSKVASWPQRARYALGVPPKPGRTARTAEVALRFGEVRLKRPASAARDLPGSVLLFAVDVAEIVPPPGEKPLHWLILTSHAVESPADAFRILGCYRRRWTIEQIFRTLKTQGFDIEQSQIVEAKTMIKLVTAALIAAVKVQQLVQARDGATGQRLADAATDADPAFLAALNARLEGKTDKQKNPHPQDSLAYLAWIAGRLGGWSGYTSKGYKPPGPKTIHDGLSQLDARMHGWSLAKNV